MSEKLRIPQHEQGAQDSTLSPARMLTIGEVAQLLNAHPNSVRRWSNRGLLPSFRLGYRGDRRFRREDVAKFLDSWAEAPSARHEPQPISPS